MLSRALILAAVMLLIGCFAAIPVRAENLEAGKSPSQIFAGTCSACHKGTRGLLKTVPPGSLPGFLRQHYTTSSEMAAGLSAYLLSNGGTDTRLGGGSTKQGRDAKSEPKPTMAPEQAESRLSRRQHIAVPQDATSPDADGLTAEPAPRPGRNKRLARPGRDASEAAQPAAEGQPPAAAAIETGPGGRPLSAKQKLSKRARPGREEPTKADAAKVEPAKIEPAKLEPAKDEPPKAEAAKTETPKDGFPKASSPEDAKTGAAKPVDEGKAEAAKAEGTRTEGTRPESAKPEAAKSETGRGETPLRPDPVPAVTPAPKPSGDEAGPSQAAAPPSPVAPIASVPPAPGNAPEPSAAPPPAAKPAPLPVEASSPPAAPSGQPAPPISK